ncbi:MAG: hypothetical protein QE487_04090 [Fluviicola sp.]|nr:hypothetical protein [Fluviicola sp.]
MKTTILSLLSLTVFCISKTHSQTNDKQINDSSLIVDISLHHQIPSFNYYNNQLQDGLFKLTIKHDNQPFTIQGQFKNYNADGLWVAFDSSGVVRLLEFYDLGSIRFTHLYDSLGRPAHHIIYEENQKTSEEWYVDGRLSQFDYYSENGGVKTSFHENMRHRLTFYLDDTGKAIFKKVYNENGELIKETPNVND